MATPALTAVQENEFVVARGIACRVPVAGSSRSIPIGVLVAPV
jgi:hypothetical protein